MQVAVIDERNITREPKRAKDRCLGIAGVETIDLVQRRFDGQRAVMRDRGGAAKMFIALKHQNLVSGAADQRRRGQAAEPGSDHDGIEVAGHPINPPL